MQKDSSDLKTDSPDSAAEVEGGRPGRVLFSPVVLMAMVAMIGAVSFGVVAALLADNPRTAPPGYFGTVATLSGEASADLSRLAPESVLAGCQAEETSSCQAQEVNAEEAAERLGTLANAIGASTPPFRAVVWHAAYLDALSELRVSWLAQAEALAARNTDAFDAAVARTRAAVRGEESLIEQFNQDFADELG